MSVSSEVSRTDYTGNGAVSSYDFTFPVKSTSELRVFVQDANGQDVELFIEAGFTAVLNSNGTGTITLTAGNYTNGYKLSIQRGIPYTQTYNPSTSGAYNPASLGVALDRLCHEVIRLKGEVDRCIKIPYLEAGGDAVVKIKDNATNRASGTLGLDDGGNITVGVSTVATATVSAWAETLLDDSNAAAARVTLGGVITSVDTVADMTALTGNDRVGTIIVRGRTTKGDGGGGEFYWDAASTATANGGTIFASDAGGTGRFIRIYSGKLNVKWFGAKGDDAADDTTAIEAADAAACSGALGLDGVTVLAQHEVFFPRGTYRVSGLNYRGAPWSGEGTNVTIIKMTASSGPVLNCEGTISARKLLNISDIRLDGFSASGTAYGVRLGWNQRSFGAMRRVRIDGFPGPGIYLKEQNWSLSFYDVYLSYNAADSLGSAIYVDGSAIALLAFNWYNLQLENNGYVGSGVAGGMELPNNGLINWSFFGGVWEGNYGDCEVRFSGVSGFSIDGTYLESDVSSVVNGIVFVGDTHGTIRGLYNTTGVGSTAKGIVVGGSANVTIDQVRSDVHWASDVSVEGTAVVNLIGEGLSLDKITVANGASLSRTVSKRVSLTDAATISVDASKGTTFSVTLGGNRTMGSPTNLSVGQRYIFEIKQDATGGRTLAWGGTFNPNWSDSGNSANRRSLVEFEYDGTYLNQISAQSPYV